MDILVIEDDPRLLNVVVRELRDEGYRVQSEGNGLDGLQVAQEGQFDAIILDIMIPGIDGCEVLRRLRASDDSTPVIMLTSKDRVKDRVEGLDLGADDYLTKPFELDELFARLRSVLRRAGGNAVSMVNVGDVTIDLSGKRVLRNGGNVILTAYEYRLVETLVHRKGRVVERTFLSEKLSESFGETLSNAVDVHMCNVRKKLGKNFVKTVRGLGYMVETH